MGKTCLSVADPEAICAVHIQSVDPVAGKAVFCSVTPGELSVMKLFNSVFCADPEISLAVFSNG